MPTLQRRLRQRPSQLLPMPPALRVQQLAPQVPPEPQGLPEPQGPPQRWARLEHQPPELREHPARREQRAPLVRPEHSARPERLQLALRELPVRSVRLVLLAQLAQPDQRVLQEPRGRSKKSARTERQVPLGPKACWQWGPWALQVQRAQWVLRKRPKLQQRQLQRVLPGPLSPAARPGRPRHGEVRCAGWEPEPSEGLKHRRLVQPARRVRRVP
ncbi:hypothetical protein HMPREF0307_00889 [Corynebacterium sp. DNF00584]|nr:hypothetical protein HMPREF0307_00889 [Corynebacterium sp. DNF00584]